MPWNLTPPCGPWFQFNWKLTLCSHGHKQSLHCQHMTTGRGKKCTSRFQPSRTMSSAGLWECFVFATLTSFDLQHWPLFKVPFFCISWAFFIKCVHWQPHCAYSTSQPWRIRDEPGTGDLISDSVGGETQGQDHFLPECIIHSASRWSMCAQGAVLSVSERHIRTSGKGSCHSSPALWEVKLF